MAISTARGSVLGRVNGPAIFHLIHGTRIAIFLQDMGTSQHRMACHDQGRSVCVGWRNSPQPLLHTIPSVSRAWVAGLKLAPRIIPRTAVWLVSAQRSIARCLGVRTRCAHSGRKNPRERSDALSPGVGRAKIIYSHVYSSPPARATHKGSLRDSRRGARILGRGPQGSEVLVLAMARVFFAENLAVSAKVTAAALGRGTPKNGRPIYFGADGA